jgi:hypothetical protein
MTSPNEVQTILAKVREDDRRIRYFVAMLRCESGLGPDDVVVVGGSALEIYTKGANVSDAIDV